MTQRRVTATSRLSTVIDALLLGKKSGLLTVERGEGETFEEGTMTLMNGQVVNATLGRYRGRDAATKMFSWQACRFSFTPGASGNTGQVTSPLSESQTDTLYTRRPSYEPQQKSIPDPDILNRRPSASDFSSEFLENILLNLDRHGLSRTHRRLFLLIDGRRSVRELSALIGHTPSNTVNLLADLERNGFIHF